MHSARWAVVVLVCLISGCKKNEPLRRSEATAPQPEPPQPASIPFGTAPGDGITAEAARAGGPATPANLAGVARRGAVHLSWMPGSSAAKAFRIYRSTAASPTDLKVVATVQSTATGPVTFDDAVAPGITYTYLVTAVDEFGRQSGPSNVIAVVMQ